MMCYITDPNYENETAGGGLFVSYDQVSDQSAKIRMDAHIRNESGKSFNGKLVYELWDREGKQIFNAGKKLVRRQRKGTVSFPSRLR